MGKKLQFDFVINEWAAYAEGLTSQKDWLAWADAAPSLPLQRVSQVPALSEMPAMMRRRVDRMGRLACQVAYWCQEVAGAGPVVFASRYGDAHRSLALLGDLVMQQALSPTAFALSVHNAIAALYSIACGDTQQAVVVTAGRSTVMAALTEAVALLVDGASEVLVVYYEAPLPLAYMPFQDEAACEYAWAWRVALPDREGVGRIAVSCEIDACSDVLTDSETGEAVWPAGLAVLRHVLRQGRSSNGKHDVLIRRDRSGTQTKWCVHG